MWFKQQERGDLPNEISDVGSNEDPCKTPYQERESGTSPGRKSPASSNRDFCTAALFYKLTEEEDNLDLNKTPKTEEHVNSIARRSVRVNSGRLARSPWDAGLCYPNVEVDLCDSLYDWLCTTTSIELERFAL